MNTILKLFTPLGLAAGLLAQTPAPPEPPPPGIMHAMAARGLRRAGMVAKQLNLTPDQKAAMKAIGQKHKDEMKAKHQAQRLARQAFQAVMANPASKDADIQAAHQALSQRGLDTALAAHALRGEMRAVLTPDQQAKADQLQQDWKAKRQERMMHLRKGFGLEG